MGEDLVQPLRLTTDPAHDLRPAWSPAGKQIAFIRLAQGSKDVLVVPAEGGAARHVTDLTGLTPVWSNHASQIQVYPGPVWTADGTGLIAAVRDEQDEAIYRFSIDGQRKQRLAGLNSASMVVDSPALSRNRKLAFIRVSATDYRRYLHPGR